LKEKFNLTLAQWLTVLGFGYQAKSRICAKSRSLPYRLGNYITLFNIRSRIWKLIPDVDHDLTIQKRIVLENFKNSLHSRLRTIELMKPSNRERLVAEWSTGYMGITNFEESPFMHSFSSFINP